MSADISAVMAAAMDEENRRRELASQAPGLGALMHLGQPPAAHGVGISDIPDSEVKGEGYAVTAPLTAAQVSSYGPGRPLYASPLVGGVNFVAGRSEPAVRHVTNLGADGLFIEGASAPPADRLTVVSPPSRPSLWSRLAARWRRPG
jgi:hypothetical protein